MITEGEKISIQNEAFDIAEAQAYARLQHEPARSAEVGEWLWSNGQTLDQMKLYPQFDSLNKDTVKHAYERIEAHFDSFTAMHPTYATF